MKNNVFITGFESSGSTLLRRIISMCPVYKKDLIHEQRQLFTYHTKQEAENNYHDEYSDIRSGEKIPFFGNVDFIIRYIDRWLEWWPESHIYHIIRDTEEVVNSCKRRFNRPGNLVRGLHIKEVTQMSNYLKEKGNYQNISYRLLVTEPGDMTKAIYGSLGYEIEDDLLEKILTTRNPWEFEGKRMCGLRYAKNVGKIGHDND